MSLTNDATPVDLSSYLDNTDDQTVDKFQISGNTLELSLENDGQTDRTVDLSDYLDNTDNQDLSLTGNSLSLTNDATPVDLSSYLDNTDNQDLSLTGNSLSLTNDATPVDLSSYLDNTDDQTVDKFQISGNTLELSLENDGQTDRTVDLSDYLDNTDNQDLSLTGNSLSLTNDATPVDLSSYLDNTDNQDLSLTGNSLSLTNDATPVDLSSYLDNTDAQTLAQVYTEGGNTVNMAAGDGDIQFKASNSDELLFLDESAGNIGIGTSTPDAGAMVHVARDSAGIMFKVEQLNAAPGPYTFMEGNVSGTTDLVLMKSNRDASLSTLISDDVGRLRMDATPISFAKSDAAFTFNAVGLNSDGDIVRFKDGYSDTRMLLTKDGKLGLGVSDPSEQLHISGDARVAGLSGTGDRMVVADTNGVLKTQSLPADTDNQDLSLSGNDLSLTNDPTPTPVDLSGYLDNTDDQTIDKFQLNANVLELSLEADGQADQTVDLSGYLDNTDDQTIDKFQLNANVLELSLEADGQADQTVDLSGYLDNTDDQTIDKFQLNANVLELSLEADGQADQTVDLSGYLDNTDDQTLAQVYGEGGNLVDMTAGNGDIQFKNDSGDELLFLDEATGNVGIGVLDPDAKLEVAGQVKITGGTPGADKVLTSDADGLASWKDPNTLIVNDSDWTISGNNLYSAVSGRVGIGSSNPEFKLDIADEGGVIARGAYGSGDSLSTSGAGTRMIWYPKRAAFRAGGVDASQWDDSNIGDYSVALGRDNTASVLGSTVSGGTDNTASNAFTTVGGGSLNVASGIVATVSGGSGNEASGNTATVAGGHNNEAPSLLSTVSGGENNIASGSYSTVPGGQYNTAAGTYSWAGGHNMQLTYAADKTFIWGHSNTPLSVSQDSAFIVYSGNVTFDTDGALTARGAYGSGTALSSSGAGTRMLWYPKKAAFRAGVVNGTQWDDSNVGDYSVALGEDNISSSQGSTVSGGADNTASHFVTTIAGGANNTASGAAATVSGGLDNVASGSNATVSGGHNNEATGSLSTISGGESNTASGPYSTVPGGQWNEASGSFSWAGGHNMQLTNAADKTFIWGHSNTPLSVSQDSAFIVYSGNVTFDTDGALTARGAYGSGTALSSSGAGTRMLWYPKKAAFRAGVVNGTQWDDSNVGDYSVALGEDNISSSQGSTVSGGADNTASHFVTTVSGGSNNTASGSGATVGGGLDNVASGTSATVSGGHNNDATGLLSTISGGESNTASGLYATIPGGQWNEAAGEYSWAGGHYMQLSNSADNTFVWGHSGSAVSISQPDAFIIYSGDVGIGTISPDYKLQVNGVVVCDLVGQTVPPP